MNITVAEEIAHELETDSIFNDFTEWLYCLPPADRKRIAKLMLIAQGCSETELHKIETFITAYIKGLKDEH